MVIRWEDFHAAQEELPERFIELNPRTCGVAHTDLPEWVRSRCDPTSTQRLSGGEDGPVKVFGVVEHHRQVTRGDVEFRGYTQFFPAELA